MANPTTEQVLAYKHPDHYDYVAGALEQERLSLRIDR